jgi:hypothetical protein
MSGRRERKPRNRGGDAPAPAAVTRPSAWSPFASLGAGNGHPPRPPRMAAWAPPKPANAQNGAAAPPDANGVAHGTNGAAPPATATAQEAPPFQGHVFATPGAATEARKVESKNAWEHMLEQRVRSGRAWRNEDVPQGETLLVHVWARLVLNDGIPPSAVTIWLDRIEPLDGRYQIHLPGVAVAGDGTTPPGSALYTVLDKQRRQPQIAEKFVARIDAITPQGGLVTLGGGDIAFPANPNAQQSSHWASPPPPWAPPAGYGGPGYGPPGYPPPYGAPGYPPPYGAPGYPPPYGYGAPPMGGGYGMHPALAAAYAPPPPKVQNDPELSRMWATMQTTMMSSEQARNEQQFRIFQLMMENKKSGEAPAQDPFAMMDRAFGMAKTIAELTGGKGGGDGGGLHFHEMKDGTNIVADGQGVVNKELTGLLLAKDAIGSVSKSIGAKLAARQPGAVNGTVNGAPQSAGKPPGPPKEVTSGK